MATVAELEARLEALKAQRASAVARVSYDGRAVESRRTAEIPRAIAELERELQALQGKPSVRQIRVHWHQPSKASNPVPFSPRVSSCHPRARPADPRVSGA